MFSSRFRFILMGVFLLLAGWLMGKGQMVYGMGLLMGFGFLGLGYFRNGSVYLANRKLKQEKYDQAEKLLAEIKRPKWLSYVVKGYYFMAHGHLAFYKKEYENARDYFLKAKDHRPPNANDRALILLNLAHLSKILGDKKGVKHYLKEASQEKMSPELKAAMQNFK